ncbi:MAG TPA: hypothetical protein VGQ13_10145 [Nitrososphaera sp.]|nr:hypothetical protein [Nitrososphaera sp.]
MSANNDKQDAPRFDPVTEFFYSSHLPLELHADLPDRERAVFYNNMSEEERRLLHSDPSKLTEDEITIRDRIIVRLKDFPRKVKIFKMLPHEDLEDLASDVFEVMNYDLPIELVRADKKKREIISARIVEVAIPTVDSKGKKLGMEIVYRYKPGRALTSAVPTKIIAHQNNALGIAAKYTMTFHSLKGEYLTLHRKEITEIIAELTAKQLVHHKRVIEDYFSRLITGFDTAGYIEVDRTIETEGFYLVDGRIVESGSVHRDPTLEEIVACAEMLDALVGKWKTEYAVPTVVRNSMLGPFSLILKQRRNPLPYTYLYGPRDTGKNALAMIGLAIWEKDLDGSFMKGFSSFNSEYKFGEVLSKTTYPQFIDEVGPLRLKEYEKMREMIKVAADHDVARSKGMGPSRSTRYVDIPALSYLILAANRALPSDEAFMKRMDPVRMLSVDRHPRNSPEAIAFEAWFNQERHKLAALGHFTAMYILRSDKAVLKLPPRDLSRMILVEFYKVAGRDAPEWIDHYAQEDGVEAAAENIRLYMRGFFLDLINKKYREFAPLGSQADSLEQKIEYLSQNNLIPYFHVLEGFVRITNDIYKPLEENGINVSSLDELASYLPKFVVHRAKPGSKMKTDHCALGPLSDFIEFLEEVPSVDDDNGSTRNEDQAQGHIQDLVLASYMKYCHENKTDRVPLGKFQQLLLSIKGITDAGQARYQIDVVVKSGYLAQDVDGNLILNGKNSIE